VRVRHFPFDDSVRPSDEDLMTAWTAAEAVARDLRRGRRVLVTCAMGRNRSAFVAALALHLVTGEPGADMLALVRARRVDRTGVSALSNSAFRAYLRGLR
jgi:protein-tyrosine phosphatase